MWAPLADQAPSITQLGETCALEPTTQAPWPVAFEFSDFPCACFQQLYSAKLLFIHYNDKFWRGATLQGGGGGLPKACCYRAGPLVSALRGWVTDGWMDGQVDGWLPLARLACQWLQTSLALASPGSPRARPLVAAIRSVSCASGQTIAVCVLGPSVEDAKSSRTLDAPSTSESLG